MVQYPRDITPADAQGEDTSTTSEYFIVEGSCSPENQMELYANVFIVTIKEPIYYETDRV